MADSTKPNLTFRALQIANEQRTAYGLRSNDYARYRKHCANRTHRLRSTLKITHGKGRDFKKLPPLIPDNIKEGHLQLLLFEAERAWAYAQDLHLQSLQPSNPNASTLRHSATGRFRRAINWCTQLLSHCQALHSASRLSAENLLEVTIYTLILNGRFLRFRDEFEDSLIQLCVARGLLDELTSAASTSRDQALAVLFSDSIGPEIRYSAHQQGREKSYDVDGIVKDLAVKNRNRLVENCDTLLENFKNEANASAKVGNRKTLRELTWEDQPVPVRNPELVDVLLKVQEGEAKLQASDSTAGKTSSAGGSKKSVAAYDAILSALSDAEELSRKLLESQQSGAGIAAGLGPSIQAADGRDFHFVHAYITYQLLSRRIQRDLLLLSALLASSQKGDSSKQNQAKRVESEKPEQVDGRLYPAVVKLLDTVLQSLEQMRTLSIVEDSPDLATAVDARITYTKARRCLYLARCYTPFKRYVEALLLIQKAHIHIRSTSQTLSLLVGLDPISNPPSPSQSFFPLNPTADIQALESSLEEESFSIKRSWYQYNGGSTTQDPKTYQKPQFFNIALNYVELDMDALLVRAGKQPPPPPVEQLKAVPPPAVTKPVKQVVPAAPAAAPSLGPSTSQQGRNKLIEETRPQTPEPKAQPARGGLSSLLGGWWGRS
ncbi:hypothetical protein AX16_000553 [Volvariella volvacea WC 439]|nr:hypothetical protein AX16_000553 [Volvariella volvacea WC 439]